MEMLGAGGSPLSFLERPIDDGDGAVVLRCGAGELLSDAVGACRVRGFSLGDCLPILLEQTVGGAVSTGSHGSGAPPTTTTATYSTKVRAQYYVVLQYLSARVAVGHMSMHMSPCWSRLAVVCVLSSAWCVICE